MGATLRCLPYIGYPCGEDYRILNGRKIPGKKRGVLVPQVLALEALSRRDMNATAWLMFHLFPQAGDNFFFAEGEIDIVHDVQESPIRVVDLRIVEQHAVH